MGINNNKNLDCKILLVDDMEMNLIILSEIISSIGYTPMSATSAKDAIEILKNDLPHLILLDVSMPDMDGLEFCKLLKEDVYTREIPVIFISAMDSQDDLSKAFEIGAVDYILKPFEPNDVKMRVNTHLKLYQMQKELEDTNRELNRVIKQQMEGAFENQKRFYKMISDLVSSRDGFSTHVCGPESHIARILAQAMQFSSDFEDVISENFITEMEIAASMHDIGMIKVPESILLKPGKLTAEEMEVVKRHVYYGSDEISEDGKPGKDSFTTFGKNLVDVIKYHHERYDGSGYPEGLKGDDIPLSARIMAVVDSFDALVNRRCYKEPYSVEEAMNILEKEAGTLYDPRIVAVLLKVKRQFM